MKGRKIFSAEEIDTALYSQHFKASRAGFDWDKIKNEIPAIRFWCRVKFFPINPNYLAELIVDSSKISAN